MFANATRFEATAVPFTSAHGVDCVAVVVKATYIRRGSRLSLADEPIPVRLRDTPTDPAAERDGRESSVRYPSDATGEKRGADVVVVGNAISRKPVASLDVAVRLPGRSVVLRVHGERVFVKGMLGMTIGPAASFERAPISYERAYGGASKDRTLIDWRNPVGRGVHRSADELDGAPAPCIEDPVHPLRGAQRATPVGFGAIPTWWQPRRDFLGTLDPTWASERLPLPPADFDPRFHQVAHPSLQMDRMLHPGDVIGADGLSEEGLFFVTVPELAVVAHARRATGPAQTAALAIDTALLEPERACVELTMRSVLGVGRGRTLLREVRVDAA